MNEKHKKQISKFLSLVLRHRPEYISLQLNENGWADVNELIEKARTKNIIFSSEELDEIVATNDKQRFAFNDDKSMIRANQGHSVKTIDLQLEAVKPPAFLYHGTVAKFIDSIKNTGLQKRTRQHVHLSEDRETATKVGSRRGKPIILSVRTLEMYEKGFEFYRSENNVWLTKHVPVEFIEFNFSSCPNCKSLIEYSFVEDLFMKVKFAGKSEKKIYKKKCKVCESNLVLEIYTRNHSEYSNLSNWELDQK